jgi:transglutaminase-like putative cysteine protease
MSPTTASPPAAPIVALRRWALTGAIWFAWTGALLSDRFAPNEFVLVVLALLGATALAYRGAWTSVVWITALAGAAVSAFAQGSAFVLALYLAFAVCAVTALAAGEVARQGKPVRGAVVRLALLSIAITAGTVFLGALLFLMLPRTARTAYQHLAPRGLLLGGFGNQILLGRMAEVKRRTTPVLHVRALSGDRVPYLKWRGVALREFDGIRWWSPPERGSALYPDNGLVPLAADEERRRPGRRQTFEVHQQLVAADVLFLPGAPEFLQTTMTPVWRTSDRAIRTGLPNQNGVRFGVNTLLSGLDAAALSPETRLDYLKLPPLDPRVIALARELGAPQLIERHLQSFAYTLSPPDTKPADPLAHFLFERRAGHCEYFASAMAVLLRVVNVPSRVVTGFQGGELNPLTGWTVLRASDAHAWVEAWIEGRGWVTFDPTPADPNPPQAARWLDYADAMDTWWRDWVLGYSLDQQFALAASFEGSRLSLVNIAWDRLAWGGLAGMAAVALAILGFRLAPGWRRREKPVAEAGRLYAEMLRRVERRGVHKPPWMTPAEFAQVLPESPWRAAAIRLTNIYVESRFGGRDVPGDARELLRRI